MPLKKHSGSLWRNTQESGSPSRTWWRTRRGTQSNWRGLGPQWSRDRVQKEQSGRRRVGMTWRGPRMAPEKVRRRGLCYPPPVSILVLFYSLIEFFVFCELNVWVRKTRIKMKRSLKFWEETPKSARKLRVNENKQTEYTKKLMKEKIPVGNMQRQRINCNSVFRTIGEDQAWWDMRCGNWIPSRRHEWVQMWGSIRIHL